ncbi:ZN638 protein, partial [Furnarius figulus]|nr:ZN638 protein [Furnarius figulus]
SAGSKKSPEGSGVVQRAAADPPGEPRGARKGAIATSSSTEEIPAGQTEPPEPHPGGAAKESPGSLAQPALEDVDTGSGVPLKPAGTKSPGDRSEEKLLPPSSAGKEEAPKAPPEPKLPVLERENKEGGEESAAPAMEPLGSSHKAEGDPAGRGVIPTAGEPAGATPGAVPSGSEEVPVDLGSPAVSQPAQELGAPGKNPVPDAVKTNPEVSVAPVAEKKPVPKAGEASGRRLDVAGAEESVLKAGHSPEENSWKLLGKAGAETEKPLGKPAPKAGATLEDAPSAVSGSSTGSLMKSQSHQNKGTGAAKPDRTHPGAAPSPFPSLKEPAVGRTLLRAVVSIPDIFKPRVPGKSSEPPLCKWGQQRPLPRAEPWGQAGGDRKAPSKAAAQPGAGSSQCRGNGDSGVDGQGGSRRNSAQQEKDSHVESRTGSKQSQEGESGTSNTKEEPSSNQPSVRRLLLMLWMGVNLNVLLPCAMSQEEELFPFNLDEFVTVDEVVEEVESPVAPRRNPPRGKRKEGAKPSPAEPLSKRRKGKSSGATKGEPSFVTLDEIGEEEEQGLLVVDEVLEEEELSEAVKDPQALLTLDEISEQEELGPPRDGPQPQFKERDLKAEPLVTVDEIGEVEELPLNEPTDLNGEEGKGNPGGFASPQVPDDPSALVTVDEIQEDNEDNPLVTLDEVNEEEDDFLADFNHLKEELNFVTVDEVGDEEEEEENTSPGKNLHKDEDDEDIVAVAGPEEEEIVASAGPEEEDIVAVAGPEEIGILADVNPDEEIPAVSEAKGEDPHGQVGRGLESPGLVGAVPAHGRGGIDGLQVPPNPNHSMVPFQGVFVSPAAQLGSGGAEAESKQKKVTVPVVPKVQSTPKALDILVPKAGFFCQICSLFYADEPSMINHCRTALHRQNMEKFMAKQQDNSGEEPSSR